MESLAPLFRSMTDGVHRLEPQEEQEEAEAESARKTAAGKGISKGNLKLL